MSVVLVMLSCQLQESFLESDIESSDLATWLSGFLEILDGSTSGDAIRATSRIVVVISIDALQSLEIFHNFNRML